MDYIPSYRDQLQHMREPSWQDGLSDELYHHGVKGMKWGVRRYRSSDGSLHDKAPIGSSARVRQKQEMFRSKINSDGILGRGDIGVIRRNTINDWRRGRIAQLETKAQNREARENYRKNKTSENKKKLHKTTRARLVKNGVLSVNTSMRGHYNRQRQEGHGVAGSVVRTGLTATGAGSIGMPVSEVLSGRQYKQRYVDNRRKYAKRTGQKSRL